MGQNQKHRCLECGAENQLAEHTDVFACVACDVTYDLVDVANFVHYDSFEDRLEAVKIFMLDVMGLGDEGCK